MSKKLYIIAGEASGDLHGSNLIKAIKKQAPTTEIWAWGGDLMENAGANLRKHYRDLAFMGFIEVVKNLPTILKNIAFCKKDIAQYRPDALVLIDYPGFNMRIAKWAKQQNIPVIYYISPQIWAWNTKRVHQIKQNTDKMLVILPFEEAFYAKYDHLVDFVGHPLLDVIPAFTQKNENSRKKVVILAGSRQQEVVKILPIMLSIVPKFPEIEFQVAGIASLSHLYKNFPVYENLTYSIGNTYALLENADAAIVKSGTSTLETALFGVPQVVCYKGSAVSFAIAKRLVKVKYIALVNLIMDKPIVQELIQDDFTTENLEKALKNILQNEEKARIQADYADLRQKLGDTGASKRAASIVTKFISHSI
jgi:lipid-A-disaccharide synthase